MKLRDQHDTLSDLLHGLSPVATHARSPIAGIVSEEGRPSWMSHRSSISVGTDSGTIWFDATSGDEGAEEYVVTEEPEEDSSTPAATPKTEKEFGVEQDDISRATDENEDETPLEDSKLPIDRRTRLPRRTAGDEGSLFTVLKKNVGQVSLTQLRPDSDHASYGRQFRISQTLPSLSLSMSRCLCCNGQPKRWSIMTS